MAMLYRAVAAALTVWCWCLSLYWHWLLEHHNVCNIRDLAPSLFPKLLAFGWLGMALVYAFALAVLIEALRYPVELAIRWLFDRKREPKTIL